MLDVSSLETFWMEQDKYEGIFIPEPHTFGQEMTSRQFKRQALQVFVTCSEMLEWPCEKLK